MKNAERAIKMSEPNWSYSYSSKGEWQKAWGPERVEGSQLGKASRWDRSETFTRLFHVAVICTVVSFGACQIDYKKVYENVSGFKLSQLTQIVR
ncbi:MAG: hypothetical protein J5J00_08295 [Deltaproteobacteria bacterium]|nr:hypothetical protein [Deltaproteobacteria bacterium]